MSDNLWFVDTNILVYAFDASEEKQKKAQEILQACWEGKTQFAISLQNLTELFVVLTRKVKNRLSVTEASHIVTLFLTNENWKKLAPKETTIALALRLTHNFSVPFWDSMLAAVMIENNIQHIYTENVKDFANAPGIVVKNPFE